jgi:hypothetical protein
MQDKKYPIGGYAPGNYQCHCGTCGGGFIGDKRAFQCEPCAVNDKAKFDALSPSEQEALIKRNAEAMNEMLSKVGTFTTETLSKEGNKDREVCDFAEWLRLNYKSSQNGWVDALGKWDTTFGLYQHWNNQQNRNNVND